MDLINKKVAIYDTDYLKTLTKDDLKGEVNIILFDDYKLLWSAPKNYNLTKEDIQELVQSGKLIIENVSSLYADKITYKERLICKALTLNLNNEVTVYTKNEEIALDLFLNGVTVKNENEPSDILENIGKNPENNAVYIYDTCSLMKYLSKIDFSTNLHLIPICVLEELMRKGLNTSENNKISYVFKMLNIFYEYPKNVIPIYTTTYTQGGGRYSYTDLLILYSSIRTKNEYRDKNIYFVTKDNQLFFEAVQLNIFNVVSKLAYFDENNTNIEDSNKIENAKIPYERAVLEIIFDNELAEKIKKHSAQISNDDISKTVIEDENNEDYDSFECDDNDNYLENNDENDDQEESDLDQEISQNEINSEEIKKAVKELTKNHTIIPIKLVKKVKVVDSNLIEHVYSSSFIIIPPIHQKKYVKENVKKYKISVGLYITFKDNPKRFFKIISVNKKEANILPLT